MFRKILLAYDGSDHAEAALATAAGLSNALGADLHVVHTPQLDTPPVVLGPYVSQLGTPPTQAEYDAVGAKMIERVRTAADAHGVRVKGAHVGHGAPADYILATAKDIDADLIVMGRRGLGAVKALVLGSISHAVAHRATCACLTVV
ncbi:universal stress protein [Sulfitobacter sp. HNIBRBA3233]|uniref:universal stress protein n=1 Tax=Sulfitobacter marinivivus TaxID=3158558 RepID=UPI0032DEE2E8